MLKYEEFAKLTLYEREFVELTGGKVPVGESLWGFGEKALFSIESYLIRDELKKKYGLSIITADAIERLHSFAPYIEIGAGTGYWAYELRKADIDIVATDIHPPRSGKNHYGFKEEWTHIRKMSALSAVKRYKNRSLLINWPCYSRPWAAKALEFFYQCGGKHVVYVGEGYGGCTADERFHELLREQWKEIDCVEIYQWFGIHDRIEIYERLEVPNS